MYFLVVEWEARVWSLPQLHITTKSAVPGTPCMISGVTQHMHNPLHHHVCDQGITKEQLSELQ